MENIKKGGRPSRLSMLSATDVMSAFIVGFPPAIAAALLAPVLQTRLRRWGQSMVALIARPTSRWLLFSAFAIWFGAVVMITWYITGILSADDAIISGSLMFPLIWMVLGSVPVFAHARRGSLAWNNAGGGFLLASPLLALNLIVPAFYSIPFATATASQRVIFDVVVGGGGFGEGLFLIAIWFVVVRYVKGWMGLASGPATQTDDPDENPGGLSITIFCRLSHLLGAFGGRNSQDS